MMIGVHGIQLDYRDKVYVHVCMYMRSYKAIYVHIIINL